MSTPYHAALAVQESMKTHPEQWSLTDLTVDHSSGFSVWTGIGGPSAYKPSEFSFGWRGWWIVRKAVKSLKVSKAVESLDLNTPNTSRRVSRNTRRPD